MHKDVIVESEYATGKITRQNLILRYSVSFLVGAFVLSAFSLIQKLLLGLSDIFMWKGFVIPVAIGGAIGLALMRLYSRVLNNADQLQQNQEKLQDFLDNATDLIQSVDPRGKFTYVNIAWKKALKYNEEDLKKLTVFDVIHPDSRNHCKSIFDRILQGEQISDVETVFLARDGTPVYLAGNLNFRMENGVPVSTRGIFRDVTVQRRASERERLAAKVFESVQEAILVTDQNGTIMAANDAFTDITGYPTGEVIGRPVYKVLNPAEGQPGDGYKEPMSLAHPMNWEGEMLGRRKNNEAFVMKIAISLIRDEANRVTNYVGIFSDITDRKRTEKRLEHLATHDFLTDLPNRALFQKRLDEAIQAANQDETMLAVLFLDLDLFKSVNDRFGHEFGDQFMQNLAARLKGCVRKSDLVARMGGDEFAIILECISDVAQAEQIGQKIVKSMETPFEITGRQVEITFSIGISTYPKSEDARTLLMDADFAMYQAKQSGKNTFRVFEYSHAKTHSRF